MKNEEVKRILSVEDVLHLQSDRNAKIKNIMPDIDTSQFILNQKPKAETIRHFTSTVTISEEQRKQYNLGDSAPSRNAKLAEKARNAIKVAELHAKEEALEQAKAAAKKTEVSSGAANELAKKIKSGNFELGFGALTEGSENLKKTI